MADEADNLVLGFLRRIDASVSELRTDMLEVKSRLGILEQQYASISRRLDRLELRVERIERRLDITEPV